MHPSLLYPSWDYLLDQADRLTPGPLLYKAPLDHYAQRINVKPIRGGKLRCTPEGKSFRSTHAFTADSSHFDRFVAYPERVIAIGRGHNGWHCQAVKPSGNSSISGIYEDEFPERYLSKAVEGTVVTDCKAVPYGPFAHHVMAGPIHAPELPPGTVQRFRSLNPSPVILAGLEGAFKTLTQACLKHVELTALDTVATDVYVALVRQLPGARIGVVRNGRIEWEPAP